MAPKIGIIIQARLGSTRLPGKALLNLGNESMLGFLIRRIKPLGLPIILATTLLPEDDELERLANSLNVNVYRGSQENVLKRFYQAATKFNLDILVRLTGDNPFLDSTFISKSLDEFLKDNWDNRFASSTLAMTYPLGISIEIFSYRLLREAYLNARDEIEKEHVTPYIFKKSGAEVYHIHFFKNRYHYRLTVDTAEDFELARKLVEDYGVKDATVEEIIEVIDQHPELLHINDGVEHKRIN